MRRLEARQHQVLAGRVAGVALDEVREALGVERVGREVDRVVVQAFLVLFCEVVGVC